MFDAAVALFLAILAGEAWILSHVTRIETKIDAFTAEFADHEERLRRIEAKWELSSAR